MAASNNIVLQSNVILASGGNPINLGSTNNTSVTGNFTLTLTPGAAAITLDNVDVATLTFTSGTQVTLHGNVTVDNAVDFSAGGTTILEESIKVATSNDAVTFGVVNADGDATVTEGLEIQVGTALITLGAVGQGGANTPLGYLTTNSGTVTLNGAITAAANGDISITTTDAAGDIAVANAVTTSGTGVITLTAGRDIALTGDLTTAANSSVTLKATAVITDIDDSTTDISTGTLNITGATTVGGTAANAALDTDITTLNMSGVTGASYILEDSGIILGDVNVDGPVNVIATLGDVTATSVLTSDDNVTLRSVAAAISVGLINAGGGTVTLTAATTINDAAVDTVTDITAATVDLNAVSGIGAINPIELAATTIDADTTGAGAAHINLSNVNAAATTVNSLTTVGVADANITFAQTGGGALTVTLATTTDGDITLSADNGDLTATAVTAGGVGKNITLTTTNSGDIALGVITADGDRVTITAADAITDANAADNNILADILAINGATTIGTVGDYLDTTITTLEMTGVSGASYIQEANTIVLNPIDVTGAVTIATTAGSITATVIDTSDDNVTLTAATAIIVGNINVDTAKVTLTALAGTITDTAGVDVVLDITAGEVDLDATTGIGTSAADSLNLAVTTIVADITGADADIFLTNALATDATLDAETRGTASADITFAQSNGGALEVLDATTVAGDITISVTGGNLTATAITAGGVGENITLTTTTSGDIKLGAVTAVDDRVTITSAGAITDNNLGLNNITASVLDIDGATTIGAADSVLDIDIATLEMTAVTGASYFLEADGVDLSVVDVDGALNVQTTLGDITATNVDTSVDDVTLTSAGNIIVVDLNVDAATVYLDADGAITAPGDVVGVVAGTLTITDATNVGTGTGAVAAFDTNIATLNMSNVDGASHIIEDNAIILGDVNVDGPVNVIATLGDVTATSVLTSDDNVTLRSVAAAISVGLINAGGGTVTLTAATTINDAAVDTVTDITAATVDLNAVSGIGAINPIELAATTIDADTTGAGAAHINLSNVNAAATTVNSLTTVGVADANITFAQTGGGALTVTLATTTDGDITLSADNGDLTATAVTAGGVGKNITLTTTDSGDIYVGDVTASDGQIIVTSAAQIKELGDDLGADLATVTAILRAATGIGSGGAIETNITNLDAVNSIRGSIQIIEVAAGTDLNINQATQQTAGNIDIQTINGTLTVVAGQSGVTTVADGTIILVAGNNDAIYTEDLVINDGVTSNRGAITLTSSGNDVRFGADGDVTSISGEIEVNATSGTGLGEGVIFMVDGTVLNAGSGIIDLNAFGNITLGSVQTTSTSSTAGSEAVNINSAAGGIIAGGDAAVDVIAADGRLVIDAATGVGSAGNIDITVASIDIDNTTSGNIDINETNAITVIQLDQDAATGRVNLVAGGTITIAATADSGVGVSSLAGQVELDAKGTTSDIYVYNTITTTSGAINVLADNDVIFTIAGDITSTSGNVTVTADADGIADGISGAITMADNNDPLAGDTTVIDAGSGRIALSADEDITIGSLTTTGDTAGVAEISITSSTGAIVDAGDTAVDIDADSGTNSTAWIVALTGIGTDANDIDTTVENFAATTTTGDINIFNTGNINIVNTSGMAPAGGAGVTIAGGSSNDNITILASGPVVVSAVVTNTGGGAILLAAQGTAATDDLTINAAVTAAGGNGNIYLYAGDTIAQNSVAVTAAGSGVITYYAGVDYNSGTPRAGLATGASDITMNATATATSTSGNITMTAPRNVTIGALSTTGDVNITADDSTYITSDSFGAITEVLATELANITAATATLRAATGIGSVDDIDTNITTLDALNSTSGNLLVTEIALGTDLNVNQATQSAIGNLLVQTENGTLTVVAGQIGVATTTGTLTLIAGDSDNNYAEDLVINDTVTTTTGNIILTSSGDDVTFGAGGDVTSTSGNVDVNAESGVGLGEGVITMADGALINSGTGQINIDAYGDITLGGLSTTYTADDAIAVTSVAGGIIDGGDTHVDIIANTASATVDLDAATGIGSANALETSIYNLEATNTTSGNIKIAETDAINLPEVINQAAIGSVDITVAGTITTTTVTSGGAVNLNATAGDIFDTPAGLITAGAQSTLRASGIIGTAVTPSYNPVDVNINGDLWVWAGSVRDEVSVILEGPVASTAATERVEIFEPSPPGLVMLNNRLMGGGNYGSGSEFGSILSRGYGETVIVRTDMVNLFYERALQPWGHKISAPWALFEVSVIDDEFLYGPAVIIDGSQVGINVLPPGLLIAPERFRPTRYYIIRARERT